MKLYVNEKLLSIHNRYFIKDETGNDVYEISSRALSLGEKTTVMDMQGNQIAYIERELLHLVPVYNVYINNAFAFKISKRFHLFKNEYDLSNGYHVQGDFLSFDFQITDENNRTVANIDHKLFTIGDKYEIDIFDESHIDIILSIIVAITNDIDRRQRSN